MLKHITQRADSSTKPWRFLPKPPVGQLTKTRSDFQLREDAIIYFCLQTPILAT